MFCGPATLRTLKMKPEDGFNEILRKSRTQRMPQLSRNELSSGSTDSVAWWSLQVVGWQAGRGGALPLPGSVRIGVFPRSLCMCSHDWPQRLSGLSPAPGHLDCCLIRDRWRTRGSLSLGTGPWSASMHTTGTHSGTLHERYNRKKAIAGDRTSNVNDRLALCQENEAKRKPTDSESSKCTCEAKTSGHRKVHYSCHAKPPTFAQRPTFFLLCERTPSGERTPSAQFRLVQKIERTAGILQPKNESASSVARKRKASSRAAHVVETQTQSN